LTAGDDVGCGRAAVGATDCVLVLTRRLLHQSRDPTYTEHAVETLLMQRVVGIALGYEDLNDHDQLRHDPVLVGKLAARRPGCACRSSWPATPIGCPG
jgi:hypothetical protein